MPDELWGVSEASKLLEAQAELNRTIYDPEWVAAHPEEAHDVWADYVPREMRED